MGLTELTLIGRHTTDPTSQETSKPTRSGYYDADGPSALCTGSGWEGEKHFGTFLQCFVVRLS